MSNTTTLSSMPCGRSASILYAWRDTCVLLGRKVLAGYRNRIMNVHPALIPSFCGKGMYGHHVHEAVIARGVKFTGVTVHFVDEKYDAGPIILQTIVPVEDDDTPETIAARVLKKEHETYTAAIALFAEGRLEVKDRKVRVRFDGPGFPNPGPGSRGL